MTKPIDQTPIVPIGNVENDSLPPQYAFPMMRILVDIPPLGHVLDLDAFRKAFGVTYQAIWSDCQKQARLLDKPEEKMLEIFYHLSGAYPHKTKEIDFLIDLLKKRRSGGDSDYNELLEFLHQESSNIELEEKHFLKVFGEKGEDYFLEYKESNCIISWASNHMDIHNDSKIIEVIRLGFSELELL